MAYNKNNKNNKNNKENTYTIVDFPENGKYYGKFVAKKPKIAGIGAFSTLMNFVNNNSDNFTGKFIVFVIRNIDTKKEYKYIGNRVKLENKVYNNKVNKNGNRLEYIYKDVVGVYREELDKI
jgi:hypothetical protein